MKEKPILMCGEMVRATLEDRKTQTRRIINFPDNLFDDVPFCLSSSIDEDGVMFGDSQNIFECFCKFQIKCPYDVDRLWVKETWRVGAWAEDQCIAVDYRADNYARREWLEVPDEKQFEKLWQQSTDDAIKAGFKYDAEGNYKWEHGQSPCRWRPSIFMPRWASRINLAVKNIRVERVQDITEEDAKAEGVNGGCANCGNQQPCGCKNPEPLYRDSYIWLWNSINAKPKPVYVKQNGKRVIEHYESFPWEDIQETKTYRGKPWHIQGNPWVWVVEFERERA